MSENPSLVTVFGLTVDLSWVTIDRPALGTFGHECSASSFYLEIPEIARFLVHADRHHVAIEKAHPDIPFEVISTWLKGTVIAYLLQYHGYLVLHGSAVWMAEGAVIFSGPSGAGKSTLACALSMRGHPLITDDLLVIKKDMTGRYILFPGPPKLKLWADGMQYFNYDMSDAERVMLKVNKYGVLVKKTCQTAVPIQAFYGLSLHESEQNPCFERLSTAQALKIVMQNVYRYFMLKPLGQLSYFLEACRELTEQMTVYQLTRAKVFVQLEDIVDHIELNQGMKR